MRYWESVEALLDDLPKLDTDGRRIRYLIAHHTWSPDKDSFDGERSVKGMVRYWRGRQKASGWKNPPGGHFVVGPAGDIWAPFDDLALPLSASSSDTFNHQGVAVEIVGNFDEGRDELVNPQRHAVIGLFAGLMVQFGLSSADVFFHRDAPAARKTCPGSGLDRSQFRMAIDAAKGWAFAQLRVEPARRNR